MTFTSHDMKVVGFPYSLFSSGLQRIMVIDVYDSPLISSLRDLKLFESLDKRMPVNSCLPSSAFICKIFR